MKVKVKDLIDLIDYNRESDTEVIEVCRMGGGWDEFDEASTASALLVPIYEAPIKCMEATAQNTIRIDIDWDALDIYGWDDDTEDTDAQNNH